ncbi:MAG: isopentenyl diphosphate isomerase/L-lactate dehydrogenase-like FMN-dependent dehydrogenase [Verrucomicrobiales bacterium]
MSWMKSRASLPVILKGILTAEDAIQLVDLGLDGVYISNHGGRHLDRTTDSAFARYRWGDSGSRVSATARG